MRPSYFNFLFSPLINITGIGDKTLSHYNKLLYKKRHLNGSQATMFDLLYHFPERILQRKFVSSVAEILTNDTITAKVKVITHNSGGYKIPYRITCYLGNNFVSIVYYKVYENYVKQKFPIGEEVVVSGKTTIFNGEIQIIQPDYIINSKNFTDVSIPKYESIYPLTFGITNKEIVKSIDYILNNIPDLKEWLPREIMEKNNFVSWKESLINLHKPKENMDVKDNIFVKRLVFDELLARQLSLNLAKSNIIKNNIKTPLKNTTKQLQKKFIDEKIKFNLTDDQKQALIDIEKDSFSSRQMMRLLQGDVGSGKTIVAFLTALNYVENKKQVAFMVPTSILAKQHFDNFIKLCENENIKIALLLGQTKAKEKKEIVEQLRNGEIDIIVGTHTLIEENIEFKDLAFVVIDEQQRFGVEQRLNLIKKDKNVDILSMSATPIPRTLALTLYSDMDLTIIKQKPTERKTVKTTTLEISKINELFERIKAKFNTEEKIFWICPLVEESEKIDLTDVKKRYDEFCSIFGENRVSFIHGKMKEKDSIMEEFVKNSEKKILIATTVVEIGIDVKDATIMIIEHPERFGLSQLHQLRGRVGRNDRQAYCILLYNHKKLGANGIKRLNVMCNSSDGFEIAEQDLKIRGIGELLGLKQSGDEDFIVADLDRDYDLLIQASNLAKQIIDKNEIKQYLDLLYLFDYVSLLDRRVWN